MRFRGGCAADQQRNSKALTLHLLRHVDHLIQRRRNQPGEANQVGVNLASGFQDFIRRHHHAKVDDFVVVTLQHHADNILADVVNVTLHGGDDHLAVAGTFLFAGLNIGFEVGHRLLHDAGGFHHLRQEHFPFTEQVADHVHAVHQRPFDNLNRTRGLLAGFFGIELDKFGNAFNQRVFEALFDVPAAPFRLLSVGGIVGFAAAILFRQIEQAFSAVIAAVQNHIFNRIAQLGGKVVVNRQLAGVNDAHVHAVADGVVEEYRVNRLAHRVVAAEGERHVRDAAGDQRVRQFAFDIFAGADKVLGIVVVLFNPGRHGENIRVKDDVFRREAHLFGENFVRPAANFNFPLAGIGLAHFIKGHNHDGGAVAAHLFRMLDKRLNALFHRDGVNDAFTLNTLQALFDDLPFGGVDHNRHAGDIRLTGDQVEETRHRRFGVEHPLIHIDIDNLRAAFHLLARHIQRFVIFFFFNQAFEFRRAGNVGAFADVHKQAVIADIQRLKAGKTTGDGDFRQLARRQAGHRAAHGGDMFRRGTAAAADNIQESGFSPFANLRRHRVGVQVVFAKGVRQTGVRVGGNVAFGDTRQLLHVLAQLIRPQGAVEAKRQRIGVAQRVIKGFGGLAGQRAPGGVGDSAGDHNRQIDSQRFKLLFNRKDRRFGVEGIEHRLNQNQIRPAFHQRFGGFTVGFHQPVKGDVAEGRVVDVGRNGRRAVSRAEDPCDVARFFRRTCGPGIGAGAGQFRRHKVDFRRQGFHLVIRHRDGRRVKSVGFNDIRPGRKIGIVDSGYHIRLAENQQVVVALQVARPVGKALAAKVLLTQTVALDHGAHAPIQNQNTCF